MRSMFFKRAKIFLLEKDGLHLRYNAIVSGNGPVPVPDWTVETLTYKHGVADHSILDLTVPTNGKKTKAEEEAELKASVDAQALNASKEGAVSPAENDDLGEQTGEQVSDGPVITKLPTKTPKGFQARGGVKG